ncbi:MAG: ABC transporter ATP-binding protein [Pseudomonadota bacterium]
MSASAQTATREATSQTKSLNTAKRLSMRNLNKYYGEFHAVIDLSIDIEPGEFLVLLGPSGCGKSTALRMIAGLEDISTGTIELGETDVTTVLPKYRDIAMVFQSYALYPHKTVAENIGFPLKVAKVPKAELDQAVLDAANQVQLGELLGRYPRQLSGGQRQRVALARAIVRRPACFLMDEPLSNLDAKLRGFMRAELKHMQRELGVTTVYVTHDQIEAMTLAHRVAIMKEGVLQQLDTPKEVYNNPANLFVAGFMGSPPMNFVNGRIEGGTFTCHQGRAPVAGYGDHVNVEFGFRPEDTVICSEDEAHLSGVVYSSEMTGNETIVTCTIGHSTVVVKADKDYEIDMNEVVHIKADLEKVCLFDGGSGERLRG